MSIQSLLVRYVDVITAGTRTDDYGDTQPDWDNASTTFNVTGWLAQQATIEDRDGRNATASTLVLTLAPETVITARDRVRVDDTVYELIGEPLVAWTPRGAHHLEAQLQLVTG